MAKTLTQSKPRLNYTILHRTGKKELATKAIHLILVFTHAFVNTLLKHQWTRTIKGLPPELHNWKRQRACDGRLITAQEEVKYGPQDTRRIIKCFFYILTSSILV